jgi:signal transduction histidine kinase
MTQPGQTIQVRGGDWLNTTTYLSIAVMGTIGVLGIPDRALQFVAAGLCLTFGLLYRFLLRRARTEADLWKYFAAQTAVLAAILLSRSESTDVFVFLSFLLAIQAGIVFTQRTALLWIGLLFILTSSVVFWQSGGQGWIPVVFNAAVFPLTGSYGRTLRETDLARRENQHLLEELQAAHRQLAELAVAKERNRLARDLHDSAKQQAFALSAQLGAVRALLHRDPGGAEARLRQAEQMADLLRQELADLVMNLRPMPQGGQSLAQALQAHVEAWSRRSSVEAGLYIHGEQALPQPVEHALFRIAQEGLANVARHSGAQRAEVRLEFSERGVSLTVQDNGRGFDPEHIKPGVGTQSMRERAEALPGGTLTIQSAPGNGTTVRVSCEV